LNINKELNVNNSISNDNNNINDKAFLKIKKRKRKYNNFEREHEIKKLTSLNIKDIFNNNY